jgi:dUTP pyrophosphatase
MAGVSGSGADRSCAHPVEATTSARTTPAHARYAAGMRLKIRRLDSTLPLPTYATGEAAGFDLASAHDVTIAPGRIALVRTGLVIEVPAGYFLGIFARSSTPLKRGLLVANGVGVVDPDYSGPTDEILIQVLNFTDSDVEIHRGDRLAQAIILPSPRVTWEEAAELRREARGGFGTTG